MTDFITPDGTYIVLELSDLTGHISQPNHKPMHVGLTDALRNMGARAFTNEGAKKPKRIALEAIQQAVDWDGPKTQFIVLALEPAKYCEHALSVIMCLCDQRRQRIRVLRTYGEYVQLSHEIAALTTPEPTLEEKHQAVLDRLKIDGLNAWVWVDDPEAKAAMKWKFPGLTGQAWYGRYAIYGLESDPSRHLLLEIDRASILLGREVTRGWQR